MNQFRTRAIILTRTNFGEADRIITVLTPDYGKVRVMAKGVRKIKSRLAGGIELFSVSDITFLRGRGEIGTLLSARLDVYYEAIAEDIDRVQLGYECVRLLHRATEDEPEPAYYELLENSFKALNNSAIPPSITKIWFIAQLLKLAGHTPNLTRSADGASLEPGDHYIFDYDHMAFALHATGPYTSDHIKVMRILFGDHQPIVIKNIGGVENLALSLFPLLSPMTQLYLRS